MNVRLARNSTTTTVFEISAWRSTKNRNRDLPMPGLPVTRISLAHPTSRRMMSTRRRVHGRDRSQGCHLRSRKLVDGLQDLQVTCQSRRRRDRARTRAVRWRRPWLSWPPSTHVRRLDMSVSMPSLYLRHQSSLVGSSFIDSSSQATLYSRRDFCPPTRPAEHLPLASPVGSCALVVLFPCCRFNSFAKQ